MGYSHLSIDASPQAIQQLVGSETLVDHGNDQISFKHDILREWAVACLFDFQTAAIEGSVRNSVSFL